jgi:hypothetical protein
MTYWKEPVIAWVFVVDKSDTYTEESPGRRRQRTTRAIVWRPITAYNGGENWLNLRWDEGQDVHVIPATVPTWVVLCEGLEYDDDGIGFSNVAPLEGERGFDGDAEFWEREAVKYREHRAAMAAIAAKRAAAET